MSLSMNAAGELVTVRTGRKVAETMTPYQFSTDLGIFWRLGLLEFLFSVGESLKCSETRHGLI